MKNAALFAIELLSVNFGLAVSARCQTSLAPPLSLSRPAPLPEDSAPPPAIIRASPLVEADDAPPPKAVAKRAAAPAAAKSAPRDAPAPKPPADYDGFITGAQDEPVTKQPDLPRTPTTRAKPKNSKKEEPASGAAQPSDDSAEDEQLRRKLTICRDCK